MRNNGVVRDTLTAIGGGAVRSFFRYAALEAPAHAGIIQRVLAIPNQRQPRALVDFLTRPEIDALLAAPNQATWLGRRDHAFLLTAVQTGLRLSEMTGLRHEDVSLGTGAHVHCHRKGRKERCTPLTKPTRLVLKAWMREQGREDSKTLFPSARGGRLSAVGVQHMVARHTAKARETCRTLGKKRVSPHVLRHAAAMELLQSGVDRAVIALWLGHESVETTQIYLDADLALKEQVLAKTKPIKGKAGRYRPDDDLLAFLRAGISLPALMQLMGHAQIQTTMIYLQLTPQDVWEQYARAVAQLTRHTPPTQS
jgi:integrase/recombinase XerD